MLENYLVIQDFKTPYMVITGQAHRPHKIEYKEFRKGEVINGKMHFRAGKPAFVMVDNTLVIPLNVINKVHAEDISVNKVNSNSSFDATDTTNKIYSVSTAKDKFKYTDGAIVGAILGIAAVYFGQKKGLKIYNDTDPKNKIIAMSAGAAIGALLAAYLVKRFSKDGNQVLIKDTPIK